MEKPTLKDSLNDGVSALKRVFTGEENLISMLKEDHKPLKELIQVMKDSERPFEVRIRAFQDFAPLLVSHAVPEEKALYEYMKTRAELREGAFEGDAEHSLADQLCESIPRLSDKDSMSANIKVLAELVEHHIQEEENEIFPEVEKQVSPDILVKLSKVYVDQQEEIISEGQDDSPSESEITH